MTSKPRHQAGADRGGRRMVQDGQRDHTQVPRHHHVHRPLPPAEAAAGGQGEQASGVHWHSEIPGNAEITERHGHPDELCDEQREIDHDQITERERAPHAAEPLEDQASVPGSGHRPQPGGDLLHDEQGRRAASVPTTAGFRNRGRPATVMVPASLSAAITISPGPAIASSVISRRCSVRRGAVSNAQTVPIAPSMSPR